MSLRPCESKAFFLIRFFDLFNDDFALRNPSSQLVFQSFIHKSLKTSKKKLYKIFPIIKFPYLCLPKNGGSSLLSKNKPK